jgi:hypothetical protein
VVCCDFRPRFCDALLRQHPEVRIIAVAPDHNYSVYYWASLDIHSSDIEASEEGILSAMKQQRTFLQTTSAFFLRFGHCFHEELRSQRRAVLDTRGLPRGVFRIGTFPPAIVPVWPAVEI